MARSKFGVYGLAALQKVAYKFTDRCFIHLKHRDDRIVEVRFRSKGSQLLSNSIAGEFCNEILDQRLREIAESLDEVIGLSAGKARP